MTGERLATLSDWLADVAGAEAARIVTSNRLDGGAIQDNRLLEVEFDGGPMEGCQSLVLRQSNPGTVQASHDRATEFALLNAAFTAGVTVPEPLFLCDDRTVLGGTFFVMRAMPGVGLGPKIVKNDSLGGNRIRLAEQLATNLANIHRIAIDSPGLEALGAPPPDPASHLIGPVSRLAGPA